MIFSRHKQKGADIEKAKIVFQFAVMMVASVIGGMCFSNLLSASAIQRFTAKLYISLNATSADVSFLDIFIKVALVDIICVAILFVFSFSFINYIVSDIVIVFLGFRFGMNAAIVRLSGFSQIGLLNSLLFWIFKGIILFGMVFYACVAAFKALEIRRFSTSRRPRINNKALLKIVLSTIASAAFTLAFNGLYCLLVYIL